MSQAPENPRADFVPEAPYAGTEQGGGKRYRRLCDWCRQPFETNREAKRCCTEPCRRAFEARLRQLLQPFTAGARTFLREQLDKQAGER